MRTNNFRMNNKIYSGSVHSCACSVFDIIGIERESLIEEKKQINVLKKVLK